MTDPTLVFYLILCGSSALLVGALVRARSGAAAGGALVHEPLEAAFLAGGPGRVADTVLATMHHDGRLAIAAPGVAGVRHPVAHHPVEQAVLDAHAAAPNGALHWLRIGVMRSPAVQGLGDSLAERGLLSRPDVLRRLRRWAGTQIAVSFVCLPVSIVLTVVQFSSYTGFEFEFPLVLKVFPGIIMGVIVGAICLNLAKSRQTRAGQAALRHFTALGDPSSTAYLVALNGPKQVPDREARRQLKAASRFRVGAPAARTSPTSSDPGLILLASGETSWCGGGSGGSSCGGSSCGGSSNCGGSGCGGGSGGGGGSSCGGGGGGGSSCGGGGGGGGGGGSSCGGGS
ncbi:TIGR04222 domain-containing membrane protein [Streptomyces sp. NPDC002851]